MSNFNLHSRVILTFTGVSIVLAIVFLSVTTIFIGKLEKTLYASMISHEIDELILDLSENPDIRMPKTASVNAYLLSRNHVKPIPDEIRRLRPGIYSKVRIVDQLNEVAIMNFNGDTLYVLFDVTHISKYLSVLLIILITGGVVSGSLLIIFTIWFFRKYLSPVSSLAVEVARINDQKP